MGLICGFPRLHISLRKTGSGSYIRGRHKIELKRFDRTQHHHQINERQIMCVKMPAASGRKRADRSKHYHHHQQFSIINNNKHTYKTRLAWHLFFWDYRGGQTTRQNHQRCSLLLSLLEKEGPRSLDSKMQKEEGRIYNRQNSAQGRCRDQEIKSQVGERQEGI